VLALPLMIDAVADRRSQALVVHALPDVIAALRQHVFNWSIWPDFSSLPNAEQPRLRFEPITPGATVCLGERRITALPVDHTVPAVACAWIPVPPAWSFPAIPGRVRPSGKPLTACPTCATC
jgi:hypothetical protein